MIPRPCVASFLLVGKLSWALKQLHVGGSRLQDQGGWAAVLDPPGSVIRPQHQTKGVCWCNSLRATWKLYQPENLRDLIHLPIRKSSHILALICNGSSFSLSSWDLMNSPWDILHSFIKLLKMSQHVSALVDILSWCLSHSVLLQLMWRRCHGAALVTNHQHTQRFHSSSVPAEECSWWWEICAALLFIVLLLILFLELMRLRVLSSWDEWSPSWRQRLWTRRLLQAAFSTSGKSCFIHTQMLNSIHLQEHPEPFRGV